MNMLESDARIKDTHKFAELYSQLSSDKQAVIIAFMNGMNIQSAIDKKLRSQTDYVESD